jgi:acyl carrier protein
MNGELSLARSVLAQALNVGADQVDDGARIGEFESWDSLGHMRLVLEIEKRLGRELSAAEIDQLVSLDDVRRLLSSSEQ